MEAYKRWVRTNRDFVRQLGSLINGLTWLLPDEFGRSEIGPEAVSSLLGMMTTINEHIIETTPNRIQSPSSEPSFLPLSLCLTLLKDLETLVEVAAEQLYGIERKWDFIAITEAVKVLVRLIVFRNSGCKMLLFGGETENTENGSDAPRLEERNGHLQMPNPKNFHGPNSYKLEGRALSALNSFGEHARMVSEPTWLHRVQHQQAIAEPPTMVMKPSLSTFLSERGYPGSLFMTGEVMFVLRPLMYVLLVRKYGVRSWLPWAISLAVDVIGNCILSLINLCQQRIKTQQFRLSNSEKNELKRRKMLWALYLMRDPFFSRYTRQRLESTQKLVEPVPIVGFFTEKLVELIIGAQTRYTYFSGS